jgi:hypothetical protein
MQSIRCRLGIGQVVGDESLPPEFLIALRLRRQNNLPLVDGLIRPFLQPFHHRRPRRLAGGDGADRGGMIHVPSGRVEAVRAIDVLPAAIGGRQNVDGAK